MLSRRG